MPNHPRCFAALLTGAALLCQPAFAADTSWPQWRGPQRDGQFTGPAWPDKLDAKNLQRTWRIELGPSYSGPIVGADRVFTTETKDKKFEVVTAFERKSGKQLWRTQWEGAMSVPFFAKSNGDWIRSTPALDGDRLYVAGMRDVLVCLDAATGAEKWRQDFGKELGTSPPDFGFVCSPLVDGGAVYVQAGGSLAKLDKLSGTILWRSMPDKGGMMGSAFSSPLIADLAGKRQLVVQTREKLAGVDLTDGKVLWEQPVEAFRGMNILTPVVYQDILFTSTYGGKTLGFKISQAGGKFSIAEAWKNKSQGYMSTPVVIGGIAYEHLKSQRVMAIHMESGRELWTTEQSFGKYWSLVAQGDRILALDERGMLYLFRANKEKFDLLDQRKLGESDTWAHLALAGDELFVRELNALVAYRWSGTMMFHPQSRPRHLVLCLGDQLDAKSAAFDGFDASLDAVWMAEVTEESSHVWSHQARIALFLSAMRHFRDALRAAGVTVHYRQLDDSDNAGTLARELSAGVSRLRPQRLILVEPGDWRVQEQLKTAAQGLDMELEIRSDRHFLCTRAEFAAHAKGRKQLRMEFFYREMRRKTGVLMEGDQPVVGTWNFDAENRESFGKSGPGDVPQPIHFQPDKVTREVLELVAKCFAKHPGSLAPFDWPVTPEQAYAALQDFIEHRLPDFGKYEDAMWGSGDGLFAQPYLFHSRLSAALNFKLLDPREVIAAAEQAYREGRVPLASAEGFIRQILGWREFVRGIYWHFMPGYLELNALNATGSLPSFYWTGQTEMNCLRQAITQTLEYGYARHIQRLMVTGLFSLLLGVKPQSVHEWYLAVYVDAVEWVELPNTLGMSQHGDGGLMASKPYVASGKYIQRMSNYCARCRFDPAKSTGDDACPFTTLYWDFLLRHEKFLGKNQRMTMQLKNLARLDAPKRKAIQQQATECRSACNSLTVSPDRNRG